jgi:hypothetical protein
MATTVAAVDTGHKVLAIVIALLLIAGGVGVWQLVKVHEAKALAEQKIQLDATAQKNLDAHIVLVQQQFAAQIAAVKQDAAKQVTPQQIAQWLPRQLATPQPITISVPAATKDNPTPDAQANIPQADLPFLRDYTSQCEVAKLSQAQLTSQVVDLKAEVSKAQDESKQWQTVAKGTAWSRTRRTLKWIGITAAAGVIGYEAGKHK